MRSTDTKTIDGFLVAVGVIQPWQAEDVLLAQHSGDTRTFAEIAMALGYIEEAALQLCIEATPCLDPQAEDDVRNVRKHLEESASERP